MSQIQISAEDVLSYSQQLSGLKEEVSNVFLEIQSKMNGLNSVWSSPASEKLIAQFQSLKPSFDQYVEALSQYALYLQQTSQSYQENENALSQGMQ
ncbi:MAG: WXG100 family type VII secretion target [Firmicutes bacterium]|nr:WXG100 family type VII secretion target [Bacillota bacterium]